VPEADDEVLTAAIVTLGVAGIVAGAVYSPAVEIVPLAAEPPTTPFTSHVTAVLVVPVTVAVNCVAPLNRVDDAPFTITVGCGGGVPDELPDEQPASVHRSRHGAMSRSVRDSAFTSMAPPLIRVAAVHALVATKEGLRC
jgi:hypothetical protein